MHGIKKMFMPIGRDKHARQQLDHVHQRPQDSVAAYTTYFNHLTLAIGPSVSEDEKLYRYVRGLRDPYQREVYMREPATFEEASHIAVRYEALYKSYRSKERPLQDPNGSAPMELGVMHRQTGKPKKPKCYNCSKIGHIAKECRKNSDEATQTQ